MSQQQRAALAALALAVAVAAVVLLRPGGGDPPDRAAATPAANRGADHAGHAGGHAPGAGARGGSATALDPRGGPATPIEVRDAAPVGGVVVLRATVGDPVRFTVAADAADEVHVHGYDLLADVAPGRRASFAFPATIDGVFAIELEGAGAEIARLMVAPR